MRFDDTVVLKTTQSLPRRIGRSGGFLDDRVEAPTREQGVPFFVDVTAFDDTVVLGGTVPAPWAPRAWTNISGPH
jgi:hypothetical protein